MTKKLRDTLTHMIFHVHLYVPLQYHPEDFQSGSGSSVTDSESFLEIIHHLFRWVDLMVCPSTPLLSDCASSTLFIIYCYHAYIFSTTLPKISPDRISDGSVFFLASYGLLN